MSRYLIIIEETATGYSAEFLTWRATRLKRLLEDYKID